MFQEQSPLRDFSVHWNRTKDNTISGMRRINEAICTISAATGSRIQ